MGEDIEREKSAEQKLWDGVLIQAFKDLQVSDRDIRESAVKWIFESRKEQLNTFLGICAAYGYVSEHLRRAAANAFMQYFLFGETSLISMHADGSRHSEKVAA